MPEPGPPRASGLRHMPRGVWALGFVSMFMDISSEIIHSLLPVYLVAVLGASAMTIGVIEGVAEATSSITKVFSGAISDYFGRRKLLTAIGYGLSALTKPIFPLAASVGWFMTARFLDRIGKGIRGAPRDALIADLTPTHMLGAAYGLRQALDTIGAVLGPLLALAMLAWTALEIRAVFWIAVIPGAIAVLIVILGVADAPATAPQRPRGTGLRLVDIRRLDRRYWIVVLVGAVLTLARFSEAFLLLRAQGLGLRIALVPLVLIVMNVVYSLSAYPAGRLADRIAPRGLLVVGGLVLVASDLVLGLVPSLGGLTVGVVLWGLHMGLTQGLLAMLVAAAAPSDLRGTAFGIFYLVSGLALLAASVLAGLLWVSIGPEATFLGGAGITAVAVVGFLLLPSWPSRTPVAT